jgi:hypothetical protein
VLCELAGDGRWRDKLLGEAIPLRDIARRDLLWRKSQFNLILTVVRYASRARRYHGRPTLYLGEGRQRESQIVCGERLASMHQCRLLLEDSRAA